MTFLNVASSLAIFDYQSLVSEASDHLDRDDLADKWPRFVQLTETYLKRHLRTLDMEVIDQLPANAEMVQLPDDFLSMRSIYIEGSPDSPMRGMSPAALASEFSGASAARPVAYALISDQLKLAPPPESQVMLEMVYLARFTPLTETSVANWLVDREPDLYFYGVLAHAYAYIEDPTNAERYWGLFTASADEFKMQRAKDRWGSAPLVPNAVRQVRSAPC